jgi:predicted XRE-type DNA-binding protein
MEVEKSAGNVSSDLGLADANEMLVKAKLAREIGEIIDARGWTQSGAAEIVRPPSSEVVESAN